MSPNRGTQEHLINLTGLKEKMGLCDLELFSSFNAHLLCGWLKF